MKKINIILFSIFVVWFFWISFAQVNLNPIYSPDRFKPSDKFHAGCENQIDVVFSLNYWNILWVSAILEYNGNDIDIIKILPEWEKENNLSYVVEENKIIFNKLKTQDSWLDKAVFKLFFKVDDILKSTSMRFSTWSYVLDSKWNMVELNRSYHFDFSNVPECNPDIVAPSVELLFPSNNTWEYVALDSYFQFEIYDLWKDINKDSIQIIIDEIKYDLSNIENEWSGNVLTLYPDSWLPLWEKFEVIIYVSDKQVYGRANTTIKEYSFSTSTWLNLLNEIDPVQFRKLVNKDKYYKWSKLECDRLKNTYIRSDENIQDIILSINKRLSCDSLENVTDADMVIEEKIKIVEFSVFAILGWILFGLSFAIVMFRWLSVDRRNK